MFSIHSDVVGSARGTDATGPTLLDFSLQVPGTSVVDTVGQEVELW